MKQSNPKVEWWSVAALLLDNGTDLRRHLPPPVAGLRVGLICVFLTPEIFMFLLEPEHSLMGPDQDLVRGVWRKLALTNQDLTTSSPPNEQAATVTTNTIYGNSRST